MSIIKVLIKTVSIVLALAIMFVGVYVNFFVGQWTDDIIQSDRYNVGDGDDDGIGPNGGDAPDLLPSFEYEPLSDDEIVNVLLIGVDTTSLTSYRGRSDSMMIVTIDMKHKKLKMTSLMRDSYVYIPGTDNNGNSYGWRKMNSAYYYGGPELLFETIKYNFNISLSKYVVVNFELFKKIVDRIGGLELTLSADEAAYLRGRREDEAGPNRGNCVEGVNMLDGPCALEFARARHAGKFTYTKDDGTVVTVNDDYARTARQRYVITELFKQSTTKSITTLLGIAEDCMAYTQTNITFSEVCEYITSLYTMKDNLSLVQLQVPVANSFKENPNPSYLVLDFAMNAKAINKFIFEIE